MNKKILILAVILATIFLMSCNILSDDPEEELEDENGAEEEQEGNEASDDEESDSNGNGEDQGSEDEDSEDDQNGDKDEDEDEDENENDEESSADGNLKSFYGFWRLKSEEENGSEDLLLEIDFANAEEIDTIEEDFEYIRFGYENTEFFAMEEVIELEEQTPDMLYHITTSPIDDEVATSSYAIELLDAETLRLTYLDSDEDNVMEFTKE